MHLINVHNGTFRHSPFFKIPALQSFLVSLPTEEFVIDHILNM